MTSSVKIPSVSFHGLGRDAWDLPETNVSIVLFVSLLFFLPSEDSLASVALNSLYILVDVLRISLARCRHHSRPFECPCPLPEDLSTDPIQIIRVCNDKL